MKVWLESCGTLTAPLGTIVPLDPALAVIVKVGTVGVTLAQYVLHLLPLEPEVPSFVLVRVFPYSSTAHSVRSSVGST